MSARLRHQRHRELDGLRRGRLDHTKDAVANGGINPSNNLLEETATFNNLTNVVTVANQDSLPNGTQAIFSNSGGALPAELEEGLDYFLRDAGVNQYTLHPSAADADANTNVVAFTDDGTGTTTAHVLN